MGGADESNPSVAREPQDAGGARVASLGPGALLRALLNLHGRCVHCGSRDVRPSSLAYAGALARVAPLQVYRCRKCRRHFGVPPYARPVGGERVAARRHCPSCGAKDVTSSSRSKPGLLDSLLARERLRCLGCGAVFRAVHQARAFANVFLVLALLLGVALAISTVSDLSSRGRPMPKAAKPSKAKR